MIKVNIINTEDGYVAEINGRSDLHGEGITPSAALRELAKVIDYMGDDLAPRVEMTDTEKMHAKSGGMTAAAISLGRRTGINYNDAVRHVEAFVDDERNRELNERAASIPKLVYEEMEMVARGNKLQAVKHVKDRLGIGLKEAKEAVDLYSAGRR